MARKQGCSNTWINHVYVYIRDYGSTASQDANEMTAAECSTIPDQVL